MFSALEKNTVSGSERQRQISGRGRRRGGARAAALQTTKGQQGVGRRRGGGGQHRVRRDALAAGGGGAKLRPSFQGSVIFVSNFSPNVAPTLVHSHDEVASKPPNHNSPSSMTSQQAKSVLMRFL